MVKRLELNMKQTLTSQIFIQVHVNTTYSTWFFSLGNETVYESVIEVFTSSNSNQCKLPDHIIAVSQQYCRGSSSQTWYQMDSPLLIDNSMCSLRPFHNWMPQCNGPRASLWDNGIHPSSIEVVNESSALTMCWNPTMHGWAGPGWYSPATWVSLCIQCWTNNTLCKTILTSTNRPNYKPSDISYLTLVLR